MRSARAPVSAFPSSPLRPYSSKWSCVDGFGGLERSATEPCLLALIVFQTLLLAIDSAPNVYDDPRSKSWGTSWIDYAMLSLFVIYTYVDGPGAPSGSLERGLCLSCLVLRLLRARSSPASSLIPRSTALSAVKEASRPQPYRRSGPSSMLRANGHGKTRLARTACNSHHSFDRSPPSRLTWTGPSTPGNSSVSAWHSGHFYAIRSTV